MEQIQAEKVKLVLTPQDKVKAFVNHKCLLVRIVGINYRNILAEKVCDGEMLNLNPKTLFSIVFGGKDHKILNPKIENGCVIVELE